MAIITQKQGNLEYLTAEGIGAKHCFTTRFGGVSTGYLGSMNIGANRGDRFENVAENYRILGESLDFDPLNTVLTRQTHSDIVRLVTKHHHMGFDHRHYPECDGLITNDPGTALVIFSDVIMMSGIATEALWVPLTPAGGVLPKTLPAKLWPPCAGNLAAIPKTSTPPSAPTLALAASRPTKRCPRH